MALTELNVAQPAESAEYVLVYAYDGWKPVIAVIPREHLRAHFNYSELSGGKAALLIRSNMDAIRSVMERKYGNGEFTVSGGNTNPPRVVYFKPEDIEQAQLQVGLSDRVLKNRAGWVTSLTFRTSPG